MKMGLVGYAGTGKSTIFEWLTGEKPEPAFLITKPFLPDMVKAVISQALFFDMKSSVAA